MTQAQPSPAVALAEHLIRPLLRRPEALQIGLAQEQRGPTVRVTVDPEDVGRVVGRQGRVIRAIRALVLALGPDAAAVEVDEPRDPGA
jgi:predicted RNA-binding protein YlqC (UPF0109 family)